MDVIWTLGGDNKYQSLLCFALLLGYRYHLMSDHIISYSIISYHTIPYPCDITMHHHIIFYPYHIISISHHIHIISVSYTISYHIKSYSIISCNIRIYIRNQNKTDRDPKGFRSAANKRSIQCL